MLRPRIAIPVVLVAAAVAAAGVAAATRHVQSTQAAAADFSAGSVSRSHTETCVSSDGTYQLTTATYTGTATSSDARLNGTLEIRASSVVNTTTNLGWLDGTLRVRGSNAGASGTIHAAIADGNASAPSAARARGPRRSSSRRCRLHSRRPAASRTASSAPAASGGGRAVHARRLPQGKAPDLHRRSSGCTSRPARSCLASPG